MLEGQDDYFSDDSAGSYGWIEVQGTSPEVHCNVSLKTKCNKYSVHSMSDSEDSELSDNDVRMGDTMHFNMSDSKENDSSEFIATSNPMNRQSKHILELGENQETVYDRLTTGGSWTCTSNSGVKMLQQATSDTPTASLDFGQYKTCNMAGVVLEEISKDEEVWLVQCPSNSLYDKLESHIHALETLGVTTDKCAAMLYPLVESCMPEDLLRAWQRSSEHTGVTPKDRLDNLMKFMLREVEGEERIGLAMAGFGVGLTESKQRKKGNTRLPRDEVAAATSLASTGKSTNSYACVFCGENHPSADCFTAQEMTLLAKRKVLFEKRCCYCCFKPGHGVKKCRASVKCILCSKRHVVLMCPDLPSNNSSEPSSAAQLKSVPTQRDNVLASVTCNPEVFLQTVVVRIKGTRGEVCVRALFDSGSQRSYVLKSLAAKLACETLGDETIVHHSLFGGVTSTVHKHKRYRIHLASMDNSCKCNFEVLDQPIICGNITCVTSGPWLRELTEQNIVMTDTEDHLEPISTLIGADMGGKLLTGRRVVLTSGLVAVETLLGWTLMGKVPVQSVKTNLAMMVTSMFVQDADVSNLWRLDSIGINESSEQKSKGEKARAVKNNFLKNVIVHTEGRYEIYLPWVDGHPPLPSNRLLAEKRLSSVTRKLIAQGLLQDYDAILREWQTEGIVEVVPENEADNYGHYLPHRPVVKERSHTTRIRPVFDASAKEEGALLLNHCLENGPNLIELIPSVILRFRERRWRVVAGIKKTYLQISVTPQDRDSLRVLWYKNIQEYEMTIFRHTRVVFGVKCSPFLLGAVIDFHLQESLCKGTAGSEVNERLRKSFYIDNVATSLDC